MNKEQFRLVPADKKQLKRLHAGKSRSSALLLVDLRGDIMGYGDLQGEGTL
jgi:hypothetical protein